MRWQSCPADECIWVPLDDEFAVYHRPSGKTHFLNAASEVLLKEILVEPRSLASIVEAFSKVLEEETRSAYSEQMRAMLDRLQHLGLVEKV